jgi:hypothetical protein
MATRWVFLLEPLKRILSEFCTLVVKMHFDQEESSDTKVNLAQSCLISRILFLLLLFFIFYALLC